MSGKWETVGKMGVDAGLCWIGDPCYCVTPDAEGHPAQTWGEFCDIIGSDDVHEFKTGVCVSTGYGDGVYPVQIRRDDNGRVAEVRVKFI
jgi:hypothetical protein